MKALILAAGTGRRMTQAGDRPKCLLPFAGQSLLQRHLDILRQYDDIDSVTLVTGYRRELIAAEIAALGAGDFVETLYNPDFTEGSIVSLWTARELLAGQEDILLMDADVLYDRRMIDHLMQTTHAGCFLLDRDFEPGDEPVKLCVRDGRLVEFRKQVAADRVYDVVGESVGFFRFNATISRQLAGQTEGYLQQGRREEHYEEALRDLLLADDGTQFGFEDVTGTPWIELDFPADVTRAEREILPQLIS